MLLQLFVAICLFLACNGQNVGDANTPGSKGEGVVNEVLKIIDMKEIFPFDDNFTLYVALLESNFGMDPKTYCKGYHGGIWQVTEYAALVFTTSIMVNVITWVRRRKYLYYFIWRNEIYFNTSHNLRIKIKYSFYSLSYCVLLHDFIY